MDSVAEMFDGLGGVTAVAEMLGCPLGTASAWKTRGSIPPEYWEKLVSGASRKGIEGITLEALTRLATRAAAKRRPSPESGVAA